jgi:hypothetical protein
MPIDACQHKFLDLTLRVFPQYMDQMRRSLEAPHPLADFCKPGVGPGFLTKQLGLKGDFSGCYVLVDAGTPIYVGISRTVIGRLRQHVFGKTHSDASLAYLMATKKAPHEVTRSQAMRDMGFKTAFDDAQAYLRSLTCATIAIENPLELYLFEAFCAMELDTAQWNTFVTH